MARPPLTLAALATAAVPGLEVSGARPHSRGSYGQFDSALLHSTDGRTLLIRVPTSSGAELEQSADLVALRALSAGIRARLPFAVPTFVGQAPVSGTRAVVYDYVPGMVRDADALTAEPVLAAEVGESIAAIHALPSAFLAEAGLPRHTAAESRSQVIELIGRAADTGRVPAALLRRWESAADDADLWQFAPTVINGGLAADSILVEGVHVTGVIGWSGLQGGDPARDLHWLMTARGEAAEHALSAYLRARGGPQDGGIAQRALLHGELELARWLLHGVETRDPDVVEDAVGLLDGLVETVHAEQSPDLSTDTGPIMAVSEVEELLGRTPRTGGGSEASSMLTDSYDRSDLERGEAGEHDESEADATGALPLDLTGWGESEDDESADEDQATDDDQDASSSSSS
ncbi:hypothetical protein ARHIZOSPH14_26810 [Agromyces rhizosphaerae]|uniref:Aminoglycoside phosphotransferase domain-containing protein n=1 Tax=Agromyces rhizosphaerae TaxID=88374 RepID=A0A9W6FPV7_9MICO|nr:phosphotransferase [Agromyces rhizosphaerae]GLI28439.1 hypothetical protein ARHIZOSPH14_26810 [Agromyces rhizosphaerae]